MELAKQYKDILSPKFGGEAVVFDYAADFGKFWAEGPSAIPAPEITVAVRKTTKNALIIVWDGMPTDSHVSDKLLHQHLTPLDWALAFSIKLLSDPSAGVADFSIHILDFTVKEFEDAHSFKIIGTLLDEMPWVKIYAPLKPANARYRRRHEKLEDITKLNPGANTFAKSVSGNQQGCKAALMDIAQLWRASVLQSNDHHDLNNIVGPQIISKMMSDTALGGNNSSELERAFLKRLEWSGLCPALGKNDQYEAPSFIQQLDIVAIDDQLARGWDQVLGSLVGLQPMKKPVTPNESLALFRSNGSLNLHGATNPSCLLDALGISEVSGSPNGLDSVAVKTELYNQRKFDSPVSKIEETRPWMLVLDMRLFSGKISLERKWYAKLAKATLQISSLDKSKLAWHGFEENGKQLEESEKEGAQLKEGEQLKYLANGGELDEAHIDTALSLFPRLCALRWPSVPIIVFSSTRRRELIAKLAEYGNIFLSSSKPNVLAGNPDEQVIAFMESWKRELQAGMSLIRVQDQLRTLKKHAETPHSVKLFSGNTNKHTHIVIAFDEAGDFISYDASSVGGAIMCTQGINKADAIGKAKEIQERVRSDGVLFYKAPPYYTDARCPGNSYPKPILNKGENISNKLGGVRSLGGDLSAFRCLIKKSNYSDHGTYYDGAYLQGLSTCIELIFFELFPFIAECNTTYSVWFPTKQTDYLIPYWAEAANLAYKQAQIEARRGGSDREAVSKAAREASNRVKNEKISSELMNAQKDAVNASVRYDFPYTQTSGPTALVETIGGRGKAYTLMLQVFSRRNNCVEILKSVESLKTRKIPYASGTNGQHNDSVCSVCHRSSVTSVGVCTTNGCTGGRLFADYSVMAHLADAALPPQPDNFPGPEIGVTNLNPEISFDVCFEPQLEDFLHVCRLMDAKRSNDAFKLAYQHNFFVQGLNQGSFAKARIECRLVGELQRHTEEISGVELMDLSGLPFRNVVPGVLSGSQMSGAANQSQPRKKNHQPQKSGSKPGAGTGVAQNIQSPTPPQQVSVSQQQSQGAEKNYIVLHGKIPPNSDLKKLANDAFMQCGVVSIPNQQLKRTLNGNLKVSFDLVELAKLPINVLRQISYLIERKEMNADQEVKNFLTSSDFLEAKPFLVDEPGAAVVAMQAPIEKIQKMGGRIELVWVQAVEADGFWATFDKSNIGKTNKVSNPPSGWCPLDGRVAPPSVGDEINVVFEHELGNKNGFCLVRQV